MEFSALQGALETLLTLDSVLGLLIGVIVGSMTGVLPGLGAVGAMAVLMPFSMSLEPAGAILMLTGVYIGAQYGGSTTSILMKIPGESSSVITSIDGYELTKKGRGGAALAIAAIASFIAGTIAVAVLMFATPALADVALKFSSPEFFALGILALLTLARVTGGSTLLSFASALFGVMLSTIGLDPISGLPRFTLGSTGLSQGLEIAPIAVGMFGLAEILGSIGPRMKERVVAKIPLRELLPSREEARRSGPPILRGSVLGFVFGLIPGPAAVLATYASYAIERKVSPHKAELGKGAIEGVAGPEAANNAASGGAMVPLLALGIPFAAPTAILLGALTLQGYTPGPLLIPQEPELFWSIILGLYAANILLLVLNLPLVRLFTLLLRVPQDVLMAVVVLVALVGTFAIRNSYFDVAALIVMGVLGLVMVRAGVPRAPAILGFVLGGVLETSYSQTLALAGGNPGYILTRPIACSFLIVAALVIVVPMIIKVARRRHQRQPHETGSNS